MLEVEIISGLNNFLQNYLGLKFKPLESKQLNFFRTQGSCDAVNHRRNDSEEIKVMPWFSDFYLYIEVRFVNNYSHKIISISVFQGLLEDTRKNQLFRAEWDDYNKDDESRPQPHWHITRDKAIYDSYSDWTDHKDDSEKVGFEYFEEAQTGVFDTKKIHFAMSSNWQNEISPVHKIDDATKVVKWMEGLLEHIKYELQN